MYIVHLTGSSTSRWSLLINVLCTGYLFDRPINRWALDRNVIRHCFFHLSFQNQWRSNLSLLKAMSPHLMCAVLCLAANGLPLDRYVSRMKPKQEQISPLQGLAIRTLSSLLSWKHYGRRRAMRYVVSFFMSRPMHLIDHEEEIEASRVILDVHNASHRIFYKQMVSANQCVVHRLSF